MHAIQNMFVGFKYSFTLIELLLKKKILFYLLLLLSKTDLLNFNCNCILNDSLAPPPYITINSTP